MKKEVCACKAYNFPHRPGGGKCYDPGEEPTSCNECRWYVQEYYGSPEKSHPGYCDHPEQCPWYK